MQTYRFIARGHHPALSSGLMVGKVRVLDLDRDWPDPIREIIALTGFISMIIDKIIILLEFCVRIQFFEAGCSTKTESED